MILDENASFQTIGAHIKQFGPQGQNISGSKGFFGVLKDEKRKRSKRELREVNFMAPQNL